MPHYFSEWLVALKDQICKRIAANQRRPTMMIPTVGLLMRLLSLRNNPLQQWLRQQERVRFRRAFIQAAQKHRIGYCIDRLHDLNLCIEH